MYIGISTKFFLEGIARTRCDKFWPRGWGLVGAGNISAWASLGPAMTAFLVIVTLVGGEIDWRPMESMHHCMMVAATMNVRTNPLHHSGRPTAYCAWGDEVPERYPSDPILLDGHDAPRGYGFGL